MTYQPTQPFRRKRGDTFALAGTIQLIGDSDEPLGDWSGRSHIRTRAGELIAELTFEWLDPAQGLASLTHSGNTNDWPIGPANIDIELTSPSGYVISTDTAVIHITEDITR